MQGGFGSPWGMGRCKVKPAQSEAGKVDTLDTGSKRLGREWNVRIPALTMQAGRGLVVENGKWLLGVSVRFDG